ncbi:MAG: TonB-dependent receptor plug domain-containing protein [Sphingobacterium composti]
MQVFVRQILLILFLGLLFTRPISFVKASDYISISDTLSSDLIKVDSLSIVQLVSLKDHWVNVTEKSKYGYISLQQILKGEAGVFVVEQTSEPGVPQQMFIRGLNRPITHSRETYNQQPLIILDGVPLIGEHPFSYDIQSYDIERIGPENNLLMNLNLDNIESIQIHKDVAALAIFGPLGANGVIELKTKPNVNNNIKRIGINSRVGLSLRPKVMTINADYENRFRKQFYDKYTTNGKYNSDDIFPVYLSDSLNAQYYGVSNWTDSYYNNAAVYEGNVNISGGGQRANFQFAIGGTKNDGIADATSLAKYHSMFKLSLSPLKWLHFDTYINASRYDRNRNRNLRNRIGLMSYFPDLSTPLSPDKSIYNSYLNELNKNIDNNFSNIVEGYLGLRMDLNKFRYTSKLMIDFNEGYRDVFYPRGVMEGNSFASNYYGYNQRLIVNNSIQYADKINDELQLIVEAGSNLQWDLNKYNYAYAYKGVNDFIKLNLLNSDPNSSNYLSSSSFPRELMYKFIDRTRHNLVSNYLNASVINNNKFTANVILRYDGSSNAQPTSRWFFSRAASLKYNVIEQEQSFLKGFDIQIAGGRLGLLNQFDNYSQGPNYSAQVGYTGNKILGSYNAIAPLVRPYEFGWVGYDLPWAYVDQVDVNFDFRLKPLHTMLSLNYYLKDAKNQIFGVPGGSEYGYNTSLLSGMSVRNQGLEVLLQTTPISNFLFNYNTSLSVNYNKNRLLKLPNNLSEVIVGERKFEVGKAIDQFWIYDNIGIYNSDSEVPVVGGKTMSFKGIEMKGGDPIWRDYNNDNSIDDKDRILAGNVLPRVLGNWNNNFQMKNWELNVNFYYNIGRDIINSEMSNRFNFIKNEGAKDLNAIKEIFFWEKRGDYSQYPIYNPWSSVDAYKESQSIFLEDGSFIKLREVSLSYDLSNLSFLQSKKINKLTVFASANNLFTLTKYSGRDPELVDYTGYDGGYTMMYPRTFSLGFKMGL